MSKGTNSKGCPLIFVMEDDDSMARRLQTVLTEEGYTVDLAQTGRSVMDRCDQKSFDLLIADLNLSDINDLEILNQVKRRCPDTVVVVITKDSNVSSAVEAIKIGVFDYLEKPLSDNKIKSVVEKALKEKESTRIKERLEALDPEKGRLIQKVRLFVSWIEYPRTCISGVS